MTDDRDSSRASTSSSSGGVGGGGGRQERRPPMYNPEDYASGLKRFCRMTGLQLYLTDISVDCSASNPGPKCPNRSHGEHNPHRKGWDDSDEDDDEEEICRNSGGHPRGRDGESAEMGLRQFGSVSELLAKLRSDLNCAFPSFVREFIGDLNDGVTLLLDVLKSIQVNIINFLVKTSTCSLHK